MQVTTSAGSSFRHWTNQVPLFKNAGTEANSEITESEHFLNVYDS